MNAQTKLSIFASLAAFLTLSPAAHAITGCTNSWPLYGTYGMQFSGTTSPTLKAGVGGSIAPLNVAGGPAVGFAQFSLDGAGGVSGMSHVNLNGVWSEGTVTGSYTVNTDCTMTLSLVDANGNTQNFSGVIVGQGKSAVLIQTDSGTGVSAQLQSTKSWCATSDLAGTFGFRSSGSLVGPAGGAYSAAGLLTLDGQGNAGATESRFAKGGSYQLASTGSITVNADCSLAISLTAADGSGAAVNFRGYLANGESEMVLVQTDPNTAVSGSVMVQ